MWFWNKEGTDDIRLQRHRMKMGLQPKIDSTFMWIRIQYEGDKKVRNYWGIAGTYARKIK